MKKVIKYILNKAGYEVRRTSNCRATMRQSLKWLSTHDFQIKTVLDVGASNGCWSEECMSFFPQAKYALFEPQPVHSESLDLFAKSHQQTLLIKKAVGQSNGYTFFDASDPFGGALATDNRGGNIKVEQTTIDASVSNYQLEGPYLLKLDTHGFEKGILTGAGDVLKETSILIIEAYNYRITDEALLFWELCAFLSNKGFRPIDLVDVLHRQHDNSLWQMDLVFIRSDWEGFNYIAYQ